MNAIKKLVLVAGMMAIGGLAVPAQAADAPAATSMTFGVVDMNKVMQTTNAAKDIFSQLESKRKEYQTQISKEEDSLRADEQKILKQKDSLSKEDFDKKRGAFEAKVMAGQKLVQDRKSILDQAFNLSMTKLRAEAARIVADIAKEKGYSAVFTQEAVMMSAPNLDMTDMVIDQMNRNVKKIQIDWAAAASASAEGAAGK